jgi:hypothetical protein
VDSFTVYNVDISQVKEIAEMKWNRVDENNFSTFPPCEDGEYDPNFEVWNNSIRVLFTDGDDIYIGYTNIFTDWENTMSMTWHTGRSGWLIENVTHWAMLPDLPQD